MQIIQGKSSDLTRNQALEELVRRYSMKLYWFFRRLGFPHPDAEDGVQDVLFRAFVQYAHKFRSEDPQSKVERWLFGIARNQARDMSATRLAALTTDQSLEELDEKGAK